MKVRSWPRGGDGKVGLRCHWEMIPLERDGGLCCGTLVLEHYLSTSLFCAD